ncbi:MAG: NAD(P)/FAD-dependent oxidoreductase, partial [Spirochaetes bacterium]|nr:NAD(P)/FAD-dependent oxidoreductase [Spirochaetota bacterium]
MVKNKFDIIIIGAGIIGSMIARFLSKYELNILLIEKENDIGTGTSSANSGIIHSGHDPLPDTLKAEMNTKGNRIWENIAKELDIPFKLTGSYVVAIGTEELEVVKKLYERAIENFIPGIKILKKEELLYKEPKINRQVSGALWTSTTGVIDSFEATIAACENAVMNGVKLMLNTIFENFIMHKNKIIGIKTNKGSFYCQWVINCAGLYSDEVMHKAGIRKDFKILPTRGEYLIFDASKIELNTVLYPVPTKEGKGTLVTTTTHGNVMIGPNAEYIDNKEDRDTTKNGLEQIVKNAKKLVPSLNINDVIAQFAGLRPKGNQKNKDFIIEIPDQIEGFVNLGGIESPGLASAPAIAEKIIELLKEAGEKLKEKKKWNPIRIARPCFKKISHKERRELVEKNPSYGRIVCRCEEVTEGEIIDAIHAPIAALNYDAIKRRTWLG